MSVIETRGNHTIVYAGDAEAAQSNMAKGPTSNSLNQQWVFVNKDSKSKSLTRSSGAEKTKIYGHVRQHMVRDSLVVHEEFNHVFREKTPKSSKRARQARQKLQRPAASIPLLLNGSEPTGSVAESGDGDLVGAGSNIVSLSALLSPAVPNGLDATPYSRSYEYFRQMTISEATGFADRQFWDASMQLSASNEAIFHALTSLGALHESLMTIDETSRLEYHQASLSHCNRAIGVVVGGNGQMSLPLILVTCVIFTTIQIFSDAPMAQKTLESGIKLVSLARKELSRFSSSEQAVLDLVTRMIERYQSRLTLVLLPTTVVKEHLHHSEIVDHMPKVPSSFDSLLQAREILQAICDWSFHVVKSPQTLLLTDDLQKQWIKAIIKLSESSGLHPLSMRSVNLLKIARLASACLITAQYMTRQVEIDDYFSTFKCLLNQYRESFRMCKSNAIFTTVFHIDAGIVDVLNDTIEANSDATLRTQAYEALSANALFDQRKPFEDPASTELCHGGDGQTYGGTGSFRIKSLDFFAQSGLARLRLKRTSAGFDVPTTEVRWFSILDTPADPGFLHRNEAEFGPASDGHSRSQWTEDVPLHIND